MKDKANLFQGYRRISIITFIMVLLGAFSLGSLQFYDRLRYEQELVKEQFEQSISNLELIVASCAQHIESMQLLAEEYYLTSDKQNDHYLFEHLKYDPILKHSHLNDVPSRYKKSLYGNLTGNIDINSISEAKKREMNMSLRLN